MARFRALAESNDFDSLDLFCAERCLLAYDDSSTLRWKKDAAISKALQRKFDEAYYILASADFLASRVEGSMRGKYENEFGLVLVEHFGRAALALDRFNLAIEHVLIDGATKWAFDIEHNIGRAYAAQGESVKASGYLRRALEFARSTDDFRLELEVLETIHEFGGVR